MTFLARLLHLSSEALPPVLGFFGAALSTAVLWLANAAPLASPEAQGWVQLGGTMGLIGFLVFACRTLWQALQDARNATSAAQSTSTELAASAAKTVAAAVEAAESRMAAERASFMAAKDSLEKEMRTDWKNQNDALIAVLKKLDPDEK